MLGVDFYFPCNLFYFQSSTILVESPSTTELNNFFSLFCTTYWRRLSVLDYGEFPNVSKNCRYRVVGSRSLKSSHRAVWNIFKNSKWIKNQFFYELLFKCLVNWLIYQKRSMPGRKTTKNVFLHWNQFQIYLSILLNLWVFLIIFSLHSFKSCSNLV